jgi:hypothetical protein
MKKIIVLIFSLGILSQASAQSFQTGSLVVSLDWGFDISNVLQTYSLYNVPNSTTTKTGNAASTNWNLGGEIGLLKWLGVGLQFKLDNYITSKDSSTGNTPTAIGFEVGVVGNIHIIRHQHFDLLGGMDFGYSQLTYNANDGFNNQIYGSGTWLDFHAAMRIYLGRFGFNLTVYSPIINYPSLTSNNSGLGLGESLLASWKGTGGGFNLGIQYRILN